MVAMMEWPCYVRMKWNGNSRHSMLISLVPTDELELFHTWHKHLQSEWLLQLRHSMPYKCHVM
jgi:hypothetical protein